MALVEHAQSELELAGLFDKDSDYGGMIGDAVMEIVRVFADQGHSGFSGSMTIMILEKLLNFEPITPLTYEPDEWNDVGLGYWQNKRDSRVFSKDGGATHYRLED